MGPKLLFFVGIVLAHGALAAGWMAQEPPKNRKQVATCTQLPSEPVHISPKREMLAYVVSDSRAHGTFRP